MKPHAHLLAVVAAILVLGPVSAGGDDYKVAASAAARELSKQLFYLQNTLSLIPGPPIGHGLYSQCDVVQLDLGYLRSQLKRQVTREQILANFDKMDARLNQLLADIKGFEKWDDALRWWPDASAPPTTTCNLPSRAAAASCPSRN